MAQDYTVEKILSDEEWNGKDDTMRTTELALKEHGSLVKLIGKARFKAPEVGSTIYADIDGDRLRPRKRAEGSSGDAQSASNGHAGEIRTDATGTSIEAQVAAKCAAEVLAAYTAGTGPNEVTASVMAEKIDFLTGAFYAAIQSAKKSNLLPDPSSNPTTPEPQPSEAESIPF